LLKLIIIGVPFFYVTMGGVNITRKTFINDYFIRDC